MTRPNSLSTHGGRGNRRWTLRAANGSIIAASSEGYEHRRGLADNVAQVLGAAIAAGLVDLADDCYAAEVAPDGGIGRSYADLITDAMKRRPELVELRTRLGRLT